ncbi:MAG: dihydroorotate dehydrogenase [Methanomassiliicoccales archaeon]|nr:dihydroorotate dehydrogenase [Methanomassiliicoccales archaeon]
MASLRVSVAGIILKNPTILASGIIGETGSSLLSAIEAGAGAVVTKSIGMEVRGGYPNPTVVELPCGYLNAMGLPNPGIDAFGEEMSTAVRGGAPVIGSVFAQNAEGFAVLCSRMEKYGASAVELNLSCPHASGYGMEVGVDPVKVSEIVRAVKKSINIPVFAKLTPNTHRIVEVGRAVQEAGGDGIVAINTLKAMAISVEAEEPILSNKFGGLSGPAVKPVGLRCVYELYEELDVPIIGAGGILTWRDAMEYIMAGAVAVQIGSAIGRKGLRVFGEIGAGLTRYLESRGLDSLDELVGVAHG